MQDTFAQLGFTGLDQVGAFVALMFGAFAVVFTLQAVFALRTVWEDERTGRLEVALTAPVTRPRWLTSQVVAAVAAITVSIAVCGAATWVGVVIGSGSLSIGDALLGALNTFPLVLLFLGITVATHGLRPESGAWVPGAAVRRLLLPARLPGAPPRPPRRRDRPLPVPAPGRGAVGPRRLDRHRGDGRPRPAADGRRDRRLRSPRPPAESAPTVAHRHPSGAAESRLRSARAIAHR